MNAFCIIYISPQITEHCQRLFRECRTYLSDEESDEEAGTELLT